MGMFCGFKIEVKRKLLTRRVKLFWPSTSTGHFAAFLQIPFNLVLYLAYMAKIRVNHFGSKTIDRNATVNWESILSEIFIAFVLGVFAYMGYKAKIGLLFFLCGLCSLVIILSWFYVGFLKVKEALRKSKEEEN